MTLATTIAIVAIAIVAIAASDSRWRRHGPLRRSSLRRWNR